MTTESEYEKVFSILHEDHSFYLASISEKETYSTITKDTQRIELCASIIQRCWHSYHNINIYTFIRNKLIYFMNQDPVRLLKWKDPVEAELFDRKLGHKLVFRLAGTKFPPVIVYKVFIAAGKNQTLKNNSNCIPKRKCAKSQWKLFYIYKNIRIECNRKSRKRKARSAKKNHEIKWIKQMYN